MTKLNRTLECCEIRKGEEGSRKMTFVASDFTRDRYKTVLNQDNWQLKNYNRNGIIAYQHNVSYTSDPDSIIGKGRAFTELDSKGKNRLMIEIEFEPAEMNELADKVYKKLQFGTLNAVSVGFSPIGKGSWGKGDEGPGQPNETYYYAGQELLEVSVVNIPANPNALRRSAEDEDELKALRDEALAEERKDSEVTGEDQLDEAEIDKTLTMARGALLLNNS